MRNARRGRGWRQAGETGNRVLHKMQYPIPASDWSRTRARLPIIEARAIRRCGELLRQIEPSKGGDPSLFIAQDGAVPSVTRTQAGAGEFPKGTVRRDPQRLRVPLRPVRAREGAPISRQDCRLSPAVAPRALVARNRCSCAYSTMAPRVRVAHQRDGAVLLIAATIAHARVAMRVRGRATSCAGLSERVRLPGRKRPAITAPRYPSTAPPSTEQAPHLPGCTSLNLP